MADPMQVDPPIPAIIAALLNHHPLHPVINKRGNASKALHDPSESSKQVELPKKVSRLDDTTYAQKSDELLREALREGSFNDLLKPIADIVGMPDPSILCHRNEYDVARSVEFWLLRVMCIILTRTFKNLRMDSTAQASRTTFIPKTTAGTDITITSIPDWRATCTLPTPGGGEKKSSVVVEYKFQDKVAIDDLVKDATPTFESTLQKAKAMERDARQLEATLRVGKTDEEMRNRLDAYHHDANVALNHETGVRRNSQLGQKNNSYFATDTTNHLHQLTTYAVAEGAPRVSATDWVSLAVFEYPEMRHCLNMSVANRFRKGAGDEVKLACLDNQPGLILPTLIGVAAENIRGN